MLSRWTDLAARRPQAIWVLVPQLSGTQGAVVDKRPLPLAAPGQFFRLDAEWIDVPASRLCRRRSIVTATAALTTDLQRQVLLLEDDLRARLAGRPRAGRAVEAGAPAGHGQGAHRRVLGRLARRPDHPGRGRLGADHACSSGSARTTRWSAPVWIAGPANRRQEALDAQLAFFRAHPEDTDREWLKQRSTTWPGCPPPRRWSSRTPRCTWCRRPVMR